MAKINLNFNNADYAIDESALADATNDLKQHLSTTMNGSGATISLGGVAYNVDSAKLSTATNNFVSHLGTIAGSGSKVVVNGVEYGVDAAKISGSISELETVLGGLNNPEEPELGLPIAWNSMEVMGDGSLIVMDAPFVKISDYTPSQDELTNIKFTTSDTSLARDTLYFGEVSGDFGAVYICLFKDNHPIYDDSLPFVVVLTAGECAELGTTFPEAGLYVPDFGLMNIDCDCVLDYVTTPDTPEEERLEGDGAEYYTLAPTALSFRSTAPLNELQEVQINGVTVDPSNYTLEEGSTIVTFPIEYLKTLNVGSYEVTVASESKTVKGDFSVKAPDLNEHGFYYNQPYVGYVSYYNQNWVFFFHEDGTISFMALNDDYTEVCSYVVENGNISINSASGTFTGSVTADGVYCNELATSFTLGDEAIVADKDYIYTYKENLGGYEVIAIDKTKAEYSAIKTGINGINTVKLANWMFYDGSNGADLVSIEIPASIINIGSAFVGCTSLETIVFEGTMEQWNSVTKDSMWNHNVPATRVQCSDGQVAL